MARLLFLETHPRDNILREPFHSISRCNISTAAERMVLLLTTLSHHLPCVSIGGPALAVRLERSPIKSSYSFSAGLVDAIHCVAT